MWNLLQEDSMCIQMNEVDWFFEDLEYLNTINIQYSKILSNVMERG